MQTNNKLILAGNNFIYNKKKLYKVIKIKIKNLEYFTSTQSIKFNIAKIKLDLDSFILRKKSHISSILLITSHNTDFTDSKSITKTKLLPKNNIYS